jgi:cyclin L
MIERE